MLTIKNIFGMCELTNKLIGKWWPIPRHFCFNNAIVSIIRVPNKRNLLYIDSLF